ncbi:MAG TPA: hypothetical protein VN786_07800 [Acidimicrobiales bacterium]|nr:hypothetical protein [Acidimicrobiales bacterium]
MSYIEKLIDQETASSEENRDAPIPAGATLSRPNRARSAVYSIRLDPDEVVALQTIAEAADLPPSTLARSWIVERIREEQTGLNDSVRIPLERIEALRLVASRWSVRPSTLMRQWVIERLDNELARSLNAPNIRLVVAPSKPEERDFSYLAKLSRVS